MIINAMPDRVVHVQLKKSGACVAKAPINGKESRIIKIYAKMTSTLGIPNCEYLILYGVHKKTLVWEEIQIDEETRKKFDLSNFLPSLF